MRTNKENNINDINLSRNKIGDKGLQGLSAGISSLQHSMNRLVLRECQCMDKGLSSLFEALNSNPTISQTLYELDISGNK